MVILAEFTFLKPYLKQISTLISNNMIRLANEKIELPVRQLPIGVLAIITEWSKHPEYIGRIVQRIDEHLLVSMGVKSDWDNCSNLPDTCKARPIEEGEELILDKRILRLKSKQTADILACEMPKGVLAVITYWDDPQHIGRIVQRVENELIIIDGGGFKWIYNHLSAVCKVRILEKGETLIVE